MIDPESYDNPFTAIRSTSFYKISPDLYKEGYIFTKHVGLETDTGIYLKNLEKRDFVTFSHFFETGSYEQRA